MNNTIKQLNRTHEMCRIELSCPEVFNEMSDEDAMTRIEQLEHMKMKTRNEINCLLKAIRQKDELIHQLEAQLNDDC